MVRAMGKASGKWEIALFHCQGATVGSIDINIEPQDFGMQGLIVGQGCEGSPKRIGMVGGPHPAWALTYISE